MKTVLAIDPGKGALGWAFGRGQSLVACGLSRRPTKTRLSLGDLASFHAFNVRLHLEGLEPTIVVCELMASYSVGSQKGDQNDLIELATIGAQVAGQWTSAECIYVKPSEWMGGSGVPEHVTARRVDRELVVRGCHASLLGALERVPKSLRHNVYDAVGIWIHATKDWREDDACTP